ncbi:C6 transcription factor RosA-like [Cordyceps javanica]|uniref:C6 transcription factor RosA-like n=1 Tax=Cordyceps javanica TaxID=43265 RepID=A0A545VBS3_9HYPO|nr:C6 transcription factor RosA-like [Cordyceps javanica]TQW11134.1 C6 transcription factor RosA-like [Cordyceps javanica]
MAGPGGGPPRRSHTKSRKGCETCKRRHIRCDESFPQCRNCTKHKIRCPYNDMQVTPEPERSATPDKPDLMWTPQIETDIAEWRRSGVFPFPSLGLYPAPIAQLYSVHDLRLIYHLAALYQQLAAMSANNFTLWTRHIPTLLQIGATTPYVMHALLAFSAMHIAFLTDCRRVSNIAFEHRGIAFSGLHAAISSFSRESSDAILAASLVLSWQASDWRSWTQLMQGTATVIDAMEGWKHESLFTDFIAESCTFPTAPPSPDPEHRPSQPRRDDLDAFQRTLDQVQKVEAHLRHHREETNQVQHLIGFLKGARKMTPTLSIAQQYERLQPLRTWLFWMPVGYLQNYSASANSLVVIAHLYTVALLMERLFPEIGAAYFGSLSILPVEEIARRLMSMSVAAAPRSANTPLTLMEFPIDTVSEFRSRMGWVNPERTRSFPQFNPPNFPVATEEVVPAVGTEPYIYSSPAFSYSTEEMPMLNNAVSVPAEGSPMMMPSPFVAGHYLNVPSPSFVAYSPASSTFEGSVAYSDAEEYSSFDLQNFQTGHSPMLGDSHLSYGVGNPSPSLASNASYPPPHQDGTASMYAPPSYVGDISMYNPDALTMLPRPESPMPSSSSPVHFRHRQNTSISSGLHPPSPLTQAPLVPEQDPKGKGRAT